VYVAVCVAVCVAVLQCVVVPLKYRSISISHVTLQYQKELQIQVRVCGFFFWINNTESNRNQSRRTRVPRRAVNTVACADFFFPNETRSNSSQSRYTIENQ